MHLKPKVAVRISLYYHNLLSRSASDHLTASFPLFLIKPCSENILMYSMQHIEDKYSAVIVTFVLKSS